MNSFETSLKGAFVLCDTPQLSFSGKTLTLDNSVGLKLGGVAVILSAGAKTNGASIPWLFSGIVPKFHKDYNLSALVHDALVGEGDQEKATIIVDGIERCATWKESALIMKKIMREQGARKSKISAFKFLILSWGKIKRFF